MQPDLFPKPEPPPRVCDCWLGDGKTLCQDPAACYPAGLPEEKRV
jgi:hypothetical protein